MANLIDNINLVTHITFIFDCRFVYEVIWKQHKDLSLSAAAGCLHWCVHLISRFLGETDALCWWLEKKSAPTFSGVSSIRDWIISWGFKCKHPTCVSLVQTPWTRNSILWCILSWWSIPCLDQSLPSSSKRRRLWLPNLILSVPAKSLLRSLWFTLRANRLRVRVFPHLMRRRNHATGRHRPSQAASRLQDAREARTYLSLRARPTLTRRLAAFRRVI